ncbi:MAG: HEAT repeat domain-containing protein, partial [Deltaproteobacteria bacterium]
RGLALELWGRFDMPGAFDMLYAIATNPAEPHRLDALRGLGWMGGERCRAVFERLAGDEDEEVAELARWYLEGENDE